MPTLEGKTPEQIAKEIINDAVEDKLVSISGTAFQKLETVVRYLNRDKIQARGQAWFDKNVDMLTTDAMETLINAREKAIVDYLAKKELNDKDEAFRTLVARGINVQEAYKKVYA
jgi:hypothetical protein